MVLVLGLAALFFPRAPRPEGVDFPADPWWGAWTDRVIEGPDAADWAINAQRMAAGDFQAVDPHRMPSWLALVALLLRAGGSVIESGHLVNRGMFLAAVVGTFLLGRMAGGRVVGWMAAALVATHPHLQQASQRYGIDAAIEAMLPFAVAASAWAGARWRVAPVVGVFVGWVILLHLTTVPFLLPALWMTVVVAPRGSRVAAGTLVACGALLVVTIALGAGLVPDIAELGRSVAAGVRRPEAPVAGVQVADALGTAPIGARVVEAVGIFRDQLGHWLLPAGVILPLGLVGVLGPFLPVPKESPREHHHLWVGVGLLMCLSPVLALMAAEPELRFRYPNNFVPFAAVMVARGLASLLFGIEGAARRRWSAWPAGILAGGAALMAVGGTLRRGPPVAHALPMQDEVLGVYLLGRAIADTFPPSTRVVCPSREALVQADRAACPLPWCPQTADEPALVDCLSRLAQQCAVGGTLGYVVLPGRFEYDITAPARPALDDRVRALVVPVATVARGPFSAAVYKVPVE